MDGVEETEQFLKILSPNSEHALETRMHLSCYRLFTPVTIRQSLFFKVYRCLNSQEVGISWYFKRRGKKSGSLWLLM